MPSNEYWHLTRIAILRFSERATPDGYLKSSCHFLKIPVFSIDFLLPSP